MSTAATHRHVEKARRPAPPPREAAEQEEESGRVSHYMEEHEWPRLTAGVAAAAGASLVAATIIGVGPAAIAGAAGYLAYREMRAKRARAAEQAKANR